MVEQLIYDCLTIIRWQAFSSQFHAARLIENNNGSSHGSRTKHFAIDLELYRAG